MNMRFAKWATAVVAASSFGVLGCESSSDESGSTTTTDTSGGGGDTTAGDTTGSDDDSTPGADGTDTPDTTDESDTGGGGDEDATTGDDTTVEEDVVETADPCEKGSKCFEGKCYTCSGANCEAGIDNSLAGIASLANSALQGSVDDGDVNIVAEFAGDLAAEFSINMFTAEKFPADSTCDSKTATCDWELSLSAFTPDCKPLISFNNAKLDGDKLTAGGKDGLFQLALPIQGLVLEIKVIGARIEGTVTRDGDKITGLSGILAGAVPKKALEEAVDNLPDGNLPGGLSKDAIKSLLNSVVKADIDGLDAAGNVGTDGEKESASLSLKFTGGQANIAAVEAYVAPAEPAASPSCEAPPALETFANHPAFRMNGLQLGASGKPGEALDVDGVSADPAAGTVCE